MAVIAHKGARSRRGLRAAPSPVPDKGGMFARLFKAFDRNKSGTPGGSLPFEQRVPAELIREAERLGIPIDRRSGADKLAAEIAKAKQ